MITLHNKILQTKVLSANSFYKDELPEADTDVLIAVRPDIYGVLEIKSGRKIISLAIDKDSVYLGSNNKWGVFRY